MARMKLRWDDIGEDKIAEHCSSLWKLAHTYGFKQLLACVPTDLKGQTRMVEVVKNYLDKGDELGLHGYYHVKFTEMSAYEQKESMKKGLEILFDLFGVTPLIFVAPFNNFDKDTIRVAGKLGMVVETSNMDFRAYTVLQSRGKRNPNYIVYHPQFVTPADFEGQVRFLRNSLK